MKIGVQKKVISCICLIMVLVSLTCCKRDSKEDISSTKDFRPVQEYGNAQYEEHMNNLMKPEIAEDQRSLSYETGEKEIKWRSGEEKYTYTVYSDVINAKNESYTHTYEIIFEKDENGTFQIIQDDT